MTAAPRAPVLVVGAGFIGSRVVAGLLRAGLQVRVLTRSEPTGAAAALVAGADAHVGDCGSPDVLVPALEGAGDVVYCAGGLMPAQAAAEPAADVALTLPPLLGLLEALRARPDVGIVLLSSGGTVYGPPRSLPVGEDHPTEPMTPYGIVKLACEKYVAAHGRAHGARWRVLRCANVYGENQPAGRGQGAVAEFLDRIPGGRPITVYGDGSVVRDFVYVEDVVGVVRAVLERPGGPPILNVGSGAGTSIADLVTLVESVTGANADIERRPDREFDVREIVLDVSRAREHAGLDPLPLREGLERTWAGFARAASPR